MADGATSHPGDTAAGEPVAPTSPPADPMAMAMATGGLKPVR